MSPQALEAFARDGEVWALKVDARGRRYATNSEIGRIPRETFEAAKENEAIGEVEPQAGAPKGGGKIPA